MPVVDIWVGLDVGIDDSGLERALRFRLETDCIADCKHNCIGSSDVVAGSIVEDSDAHNERARGVRADVDRFAGNRLDDGYWKKGPE